MFLSNLSVRRPVAISTTIIVSVMATTSSVRDSPGRFRSWPKLWSCCQLLRVSVCVNDSPGPGPQATG